ENLELEYLSTCTPGPLPRGGFGDFTNFPVYLMYDQEKGLLVLDAECVDCMALGGTNIKPDFWPY
ncbi:MAG TPA: hypothetical protein VF298_08285, partial [Bacteroidales bacterium]